MSNPFEELGGIADSDLYNEQPQRNNTPQSNSDPFAEFGGFSDANINGAVQPKSSVNTRITTSSKINPSVVQPSVNTEPTQQPVYANNGVVQGGAIQNSYLGADGKIHFEGEENSQTGRFDKFKKALKAKSTNVDGWLNRSDYDPNVQRQKMDAILALDTLPFTFGKAAAWGASQVAKTPLIGKIAQPILNSGAKIIGKLPKPMHAIPGLTAEGAAWGAFDHGAHKLAGFENENTLGQDMAIGAVAMPALAGGFHLGGKAIKAIAGTKPVKAVADAYNNLLNSSAPIGNRLANIQGTLADTMGLDAVNETARKYQKLNRTISRGNTPLEKRLSKSFIEEVENAENLTPKQQDLIFDRLKNGEPKKSTITKEQEEAKDFFDNLIKEENRNLELAEDDLSHVKSEIDVNTHRTEQTPLKNVSDMAEGRYKIEIPEQKVDGKNFFKQQQREKWKRQEERLRAAENASAKAKTLEGNIVKFDEEGLEALGKEMGEWVHPPKKTLLKPGKAEGSESGNWYVHEAQPKPKTLGSDDLYESYIEEFKPSSDEDLIKEINEAKKGKQLPSVNKPYIHTSSSLQRWRDRVENEKAKKAWKQKLKTRVKAINSDFEADSKSLARTIFETKDSNFGNKLYNCNRKRSYKYKEENRALKKFFKGESLNLNKDIERTVDEIAEIFPGLKKHLQGYEAFGQMKVKILNNGFDHDEHGFYNQITRSMNLNSKSDQIAETVQHEFQHCKDHFDVLNTPEGSRERALWNSGEKRNQEYKEFRRKYENKVIEIYQSKTSMDMLTPEEASLIKEFIRLDKRYRNSYTERRANNAGNGVVNGQFGKIQKKSIGGTVEGVRGKSEFYPASRKGEYDQGRYRNHTHVRDANGATKENFYSRAPINQPGEQRLAPTPQSFIKSIRNSSKAQEQIKIDFDIITQNQATNRLKQQSDGEGIYFKQGFGKSDSKIDLTKDYNKGRNKKVGHFGEKTLDGLGKRGTTKDILIETKKEEIRVQNMKDSVDFIESEFAKPIPASGKASKGYVAVNRNLLANAVYGNKSSAWYEMMSQGEEAIRKAFKNEKVAKNWIELAKRNSKPDYQIPAQVFDKLFDGSGETVAEYWERYGKDHTSKAIAKTAGAILDAFNNSFKRGVLTSSSFVFNNRFGNQMMIAAKSNPIEYIKSFYNAANLKDSNLPPELIESSLLEAVEGYKARQTYTGWQALDNFLNLCGGHTIDSSTLKTMKAATDNGLHFKVIKGETVPKKMIESHNAKSLAAEAANICIGLPNKAFNSLCDRLMKFNEAMERFERKQVYGIKMNRVKKDLVKKTGQSMFTQEEMLNHIKDHPELEATIIKSVEDTLGDYNNFNKFEKKVLKRIVPFYSWYRTITRHTATLAKENPARCAMIFLELERLKDKDEDLKEWQKGAIRTGLYDSRSNKELLVNKTAQIPYSTFKEFIDESGKGGLSPAIKKPMEALRGKQFFNDSEITSRRYMKTTKGWDEKAQQGYLDKKTGDFKEGDLPLSPRLNYVGKELLNTAYPVLRSPLIKPEATIQGLGNLIVNGEYKEPDKLYDSDLGGYNKNDKFYGDKKRWAANDTSTSTKFINRLLGLSLQNKQPLSKAEREALKEKWIRQMERVRNGL